MSYYRVCPYCQAHLDPGERCDCRREENRNVKRKENHHEKPHD